MRCVAWVAIGLVTVAWGDGCVMEAEGTSPLPLTEDRQRAAIVFRGGVEHLLVGVSAAGRARDAAWLLPVPTSVTSDHVVLARPEALAKLFAVTAPRHLRTLDRAEDVAGAGPLAFVAPFVEMFGTAGTLATELAASGEEPDQAVGATLQDSFERGPYHLDLLSATSGAELLAWLQGRGYRLPSRLGELADGYLRTGYRFVAMRLSGAGDGPVAPELPPLQLSFAAERPWFPLRVSQATAPPRVLLELVVACDWPATCLDCPQYAYDPRNKERIGRLADWRARTAARLRYAGLLREGQTPLSGETARAAGILWGADSDLWLTRYWGLLDRDALADLRFATVVSPGTLPDWRPTELGRGHTALPRWLRLLGSRWGPVLLVLLLLVRGWRPDARRDEPDSTVDPAGASPSKPARPGAVVGLGLLLLGLATGDLAWLDVFAGAVALAVLACWGSVLGIGLLALLGRAGVPRRDHAGWLAFGVAVIAAGAADGAVRVGYATEVWRYAVMWYCWLALVVTTQAVVGCLVPLAGRHRHLPWLLLAASACGGLVACELDLTYRVLVTACVAQDPTNAREPLLRVVRQFRADHGAWPRDLTDLTATSLPATGLDTAGNVVPLPPTPWRRYLIALPAEPISGGLRPWRYDPSDELVVDAQWRFD